MSTSVLFNLIRLFVNTMQHNHHSTTPVQRRFAVTLYPLLMLFLLGSLALGTGGCKAKKEARAAAAAKAETIAKARADLLSVINDQGSMTLEEKEEVVARVKDMNLQDAEIQNLIDRAEAAIAEERSAGRGSPATGPSTGSGTVNAASMNNTLRDIARASGSEANFKIQEAMSMFASPDTPVLIVISQSGDQVDYDEPTTIKKYLDYLKDTRNEPATVKNLEFDANGKIKEVELTKNYNR